MGMLELTNIRCYSDYDYEVIIIDDNGPDGTQEVAKELQKLYGKDRIVSVPLKSLAPLLSDLNFLDFLGFSGNLAKWQLGLPSRGLLPTPCALHGKPWI